MCIAAQFIRDLPPEIPTPDISVDSDGDIGLDWWFDTRTRMSIGFGAKGIPWALMADGERTRWDGGRYSSGFGVSSASEIVAMLRDLAAKKAASPA